ncbi:hypothetical protein [Mycobacteroides abscessus]|uniref:hypothetical protein n=1 Tax=Mycobacteroides abscessus TaxID=36809 RepID=UPI0013F5E1DA|nr:hypothetical protein [Mycobacteroides abscessus]
MTTGVTEYLLNAGIDPLRAGLDGYNIVRGVLEGIGDMPVADLLNWGNDDYESSG